MALDNFIDNYIAFASKLTDAPPIFHRGIAYTLVATALGNKVFLRRGGKIVYPNLWILLIGASGITRKSTALGIGKKVIRDTCPQLLYPNEFSPEKLVAILEDQPFGLISASEFGAFIGAISRDYARGLKEFLTDSYEDNEIFKRAIKSESRIVQNLALSFLGASNANWLIHFLSEADVMGGFLPRFLFFVGHQTHLEAFLPPMEQTKFDAIKKDFGNILAMSGELSLSKNAYNLFKTWFHDELIFLVNKNGITPLIHPFIARLDSQVLKLAMCEHCANFNNLFIREIDSTSISKAIAVVKDRTKNLADLLKYELAFSTHGKGCQQVLKFLLDHNGQATVSQLMQAFRFKTSALWDILKTLETAKDISILPLPQKTKGGRPGYEISLYPKEIK